MHKEKFFTKNKSGKPFFRLRIWLQYAKKSEEGGTCLEYIIGISRQDIALRPLVEHRLPLQSVLNGSIQIKREADNYIWMELCGPAQVLALAEILADIIV